MTNRSVSPADVVVAAKDIRDIVFTNEPGINPNQSWVYFDGHIRRKYCFRQTVRL